MGKLPGTSWVIADDDGKDTFTVELARFGIDRPISSIDAISLVMQSLEVPVRQANLGPLKLGKIISNSAQSEAGLFIDLGFTEGASVGAVCPRLTNDVKLTVARSSPALRGMVWGVLAVFCIGGVVFGMTIFDTWDPQLRLAVGLLIGVFVAVGVIKVLSSSQALAGGRSGELAKDLAAVVQTWVDSDPANASKDDRPKKKRRKKRKRKKRAPDDAELDARLDAELAAED